MKRRVDRLLSNLGVFWSNVASRLQISDFLDIAILSVVVYYLLKLTLDTRANQVLKGIGIAFVAYWLSDLLRLSALKWVLRYVMDAGAVVLVVLFQPEIRRVLEQLGRRTKIEHSLSSETQTQVGQGIEETIRAVQSLSRRKVGALMVFEHRTGLAEVIETGTVLDSRISAALIENIFEPNTPLHDGAVVVRGSRIVSAGCFLPLTEENSISKQLGTRHRAAIGVTENTDAVSLIVSEETGTISMARGGKLTRHLGEKALRDTLKSLYEPQTELRFKSFMQRVYALIGGRKDEQ